MLFLQRILLPFAINWNQLGSVPSLMIVPGSIYCNLVMGLDKEDVLKDEEAMRNMTHLGQTTPGSARR